MKQNTLFGAVALLAGSLLAADSNTQDAVKAASKSLGEKNNYSWKTTIDLGSDQPGIVEGTTEKGGATVMAIARGNWKTEAVLKGRRGALKMDDGWKSLTEVIEDSSQAELSQAIARVLQSFRTPAVEAEDLAGKTKDLKSAAGANAGDLKSDAAKDLLLFGRGSDPKAPNVSGASGSVKFWLKGGLLFKYEHTERGAFSGGGNDRDVNMKTTVEIKDVGTTKVTVPEEAANKL
jgi:hypothetical protein